MVIPTGVAQSRAIISGWGEQITRTGNRRARAITIEFLPLFRLAPSCRARLLRAAAWLHSHGCLFDCHRRGHSAIRWFQGQRRFATRSHAKSTLARPIPAHIRCVLADTSRVSHRPIAKYFLVAPMLVLLSRGTGRRKRPHSTPLLSRPYGLGCESIYSIHNEKTIRQ